MNIQLAPEKKKDAWEMTLGLWGPQRLFSGMDYSTSGGQGVVSLLFQDFLKKNKQMALQPMNFF